MDDRCPTPWRTPTNGTLGKSEHRAVSDTEALAWIRLMRAWDRFARYFPPRQALAEMNRALETILWEHGIDPILSVRADAMPRLPQTVLLAVDACRMVGATQYAIRNLRFRVVGDSRSSVRTIVTAIQLGMLLQRFGELLQLPSAIRGRKVLAGAESAHVKTHGTPEEKAGRWREIYARWSVIYAANPAWAKRAVDGETAKQLSDAGLKTSIRTVQRVRLEYLSEK